MTYKKWWDDSGGDLNGKRSTELKAIDKAFGEFLLAAGAGKDAKMIALFDAISAWQNSKKNIFGTEKWENSKRADAVRALATWVADEVQKRTVEPGWDNNHNCYAYAMKCQHPGGRGNNSRPGVIAGAPYAGQNVANWKTLLTNAVQADAVHGGVVINVLPQTTASPCPATLGAARYLVAAIGFPAGYHFMRRDEHTMRWSHKNGAPADVANLAFQAYKSRYLPITDNVAVDMVTHPGNWGDTTVGMSFVAYLSVPAAGIMVAGPP